MLSKTGNVAFGARANNLLCWEVYEEKVPNNGNVVTTALAHNKSNFREQENATRTTFTIHSDERHPYQTGR